MKKTTPLLLLFIMATQLLTAQISPKVLKKFPAHIVEKISELTATQNISEEKLIKIGTELLKKDSLANASLTKGETIAKAMNYYTLEPQFIKNTLNQEEAERYYAHLDPENRFLVALTLVKELNLDPNQIIALRKQNEILDSRKNMDVYKKNDFYKRELDVILSKKQYETLITYLYKTEATTQSMKDWRNILRYDLAPLKDSTVILPELYKYNLIRFAAFDPKLNESEDRVSRQIKDKMFVEIEPKILTHCHIASQQYFKNNLFAEVILFEKETNLSKIQVDSLLANYKRLEILKHKNNTDPEFIISYSQITDIENKGVSRLLEPKQLWTFLLNKNSFKAKKTAYNDWLILEKQNLAANLDKTKTVQEFTTYYENFMVANDLVWINNNQMNIFIKRDMELRKPKLLEQIENIKQTENNAKGVKNDLKW